MDYVIVTTETYLGKEKKIYRNFSEAVEAEESLIIEIIVNHKDRYDLSLWTNKKDNQILLLNNKTKNVVFIKEFNSYKDYLIKEGRGDYCEHVKK